MPVASLFQRRCCSLRGEKLIDRIGSVAYVPVSNVSSVKFPHGLKGRRMHWGLCKFFGGGFVQGVTHFSPVSKLWIWFLGSLSEIRTK